MNDSVQLVFFGEILDGFQRDDVQRRLGELLKLDEAKRAQLFSGARRVLKRAVTRAEAERYVQHLAKIGARLHVEPDAPQPAVANVAAPVKPAAAPTPQAPAAPTLLPQAPAAVATVAATTTPAEEEIVCPTCGERQSKRILCRACATNMPMGIAAKEEAEREAREARQAEWRAKRGLAPVGELAAASSGEESAATWGISFSGRIGRLRYMTAGFVLFTAMVLLTLYLMKHLNVSGFVLFTLGMLVVMLASVRLSVLRLHDFNRSGWWSGLMLVPYLGNVMGLVVALLPGTNGSNDHGDEPPKGSWVKLAVSIVVFCLSLGVAMQSFVEYYDKQGEGLSDNPALQNEQAAAQAMAATMLPSGEAKAAFESQYQGAQTHKVFATSSHGGWGFAAGKPSLEAALMEALSDCEARRPPYTPECSPVNVNGQWGRFEER